MKKVIIIDNYDSFTYNLAHYIEGILDHLISVKRNDEIQLDGLKEFEYIIFSPGPGLPIEAGAMNQLIKEFSGTKKILGVCLGMQAIAEVFGGRLMNLESPSHGVATQIKCEVNDPLYKNLPNTFDVGRYHSWAVSPQSLPTNFEVTATSEDGVIMSFRHKELPIFGVQYHPESILTEHGKSILANFLEV